jgi:hypothetical protein
MAGQISVGKMAALSSAVKEKLPLPPLKWPDDPSKLGMTPLDIRILDIVIQNLHQQLPPKTVIDSWVTDPSLRIERGTELQLPDRTLAGMPRRVVVYGDRVFVVLNTKNGVRTVAGGATQSKLKLVYNPVSGATYLKKRIYSVEQDTLVRFISNLDQKVSGFAEIGHVENRKGRTNYFEKEYSFTLTRYCRTVRPEHRKAFDIRSLSYLQDALKILHQTTYEPPRLVRPGINVVFRQPSLCWIGDISPNNCVIEINEAGNIETRLIDYGFALDLRIIASLPGWEPPEIAAGTEDAKAYNLKYGTKKDAWQFALLWGSILRGGVLFGSDTGNPLPALTVILDKLVVRDGKMDVSGLKELTQSEVDEYIRDLIANERREDIKKIWETIGKWLQVDPDQRPSVGEFSIKINFIEPEKMAQQV